MSIVLRTSTGALKLADGYTPPVPAPMSNIPYLTHACPHGNARQHCLPCAEIDLIIEQFVQWTVSHIMPEFYEDFLTIPDIYRTDSRGKKSKISIDRIIAGGNVEEIEEMVELVTNGDVKARIWK